MPSANGAGTFYSAIWDTSGTDWLIHNGSTDATIDLRAATLEYEIGGGGFVSQVEGIFGGLTIAHDVVIENARGGDGDDIIQGNDVSNRVVGGGGEDRLYGRNGNDFLEGGDGGDALFGGGGIDTASFRDSTSGVTADLRDGVGSRGEASGDTYSLIENLAGGDYTDSLRGDNTNNRLDGREGNDFLYGRGGDDFLNGGANSDVLNGGAGDDTLTGSTGADTLDGGSGDDTLLGGTNDGNEDTFVFSLGYDEDRINGYEQGNDRIELDNVLWAGNSNIVSRKSVIDEFGSLNANGTILTLDFGGGDVLEVQNSAGIDFNTLGSDLLIV